MTAPPLTELPSAAPPTRPTTEAERALVEQILRADRRGVTGAAMFTAALAPPLAVFAIADHEPVLAFFCLTIGFGGAAVQWRLWRGTRERRASDPDRAVRLDGSVRLAGWSRADEATVEQVQVGGRAVTVPAHWRGYLADGEHHAVWVVETETGSAGAPLASIAVAVERGPSADADAALDADRLLDVRNRPGRLIATAVGLILSMLPLIGLAAGFDTSPLVLALAVCAGLGAGTVLVAHVLHRDRVHRAYFDGGARFAVPARTRRRAYLREAAMFGTMGAAAGAFVAVLKGVPVLPLAVVCTPSLALLAQLRPLGPPADTSNPGTGNLVPAAP